MIHCTSGSNVKHSAVLCAQKHATAFIPIVTAQPRSSPQQLFITHLKSLNVTHGLVYLLKNARFSRLPKAINVIYMWFLPNGDSELASKPSIYVGQTVQTLHNRYSSSSKYSKGLWDLVTMARTQKREGDLCLVFSKVDASVITPVDEQLAESLEAFCNVYNIR